MYSPNTKANQELKQIMRDFNESYKSICRQTRDERIKAMAPGSPIPEEGVIYSEDGKRIFADECNKYRAKAHGIIDQSINDLKRKMTDAPSPEAVNSISLLNLRDDVSEREISDLLERYGDNPQSYRAINSVARAHNIRAFGDHPIIASMENLEALSSSIDNILVPGNNNITDGLISFFDISIDSAFPLEE